MTELINSLKTLAYSAGTINCDRRHSSGQLRIIPLLNLGGIGVGGRSQADTGFTQWRDAMRMVSRLPGGLPVEFRLKLWENLSEKYLSEKSIPWSRVLAKSATPTSRDIEIADQIHKDLHRTGCTGFSGAKQAKLKSVLVAYGRWNPSVGYCQGFNMIGAMLLEMTGGDETLTLKVLIFLIEGVLPQGYFNGGLRGLAVDMAVFREILRIRKPTLHAQLCRLQGGEEQPPLIDVFTMHWFLTLFIHCLPTPSVLRIWDLVLLEGSEVLLRAALVLWAAIETRILEVRSADQFYSVMGLVTKEMLEFGLMDPNSLVKCIVSVGPFPFPGLIELRQKHRALIQQDTPYKSFFLAKRELDNLKKHYAAIRHRQKATTIILKGLEGSRMKVPGQRSNSLFIPTTKKTTVSPKPKLRRGSSGASTAAALAKGALMPSNNNAINRNHSNVSTSQSPNNTSSATQNMNNNNRQQLLTNKNVNNANHQVHVKTTKVTQSWDKSQKGCPTSSSTTAAANKAGKSFRRRRTLSSSSIATSSSSSTELCDSSSDESEPECGGCSVAVAGAIVSSSSSEGVWSDSDNKWVKKKKLSSRNKHRSQLSLDKRHRNHHPSSQSAQAQDSAKENETPSENCCVQDKMNGMDGKNVVPSLTLGLDDNEHQLNKKDSFETFSMFEFQDPGSPTPSAQSDPGGNVNGTHLSRSSSIIDTNDSQHFLEEMSKLGKSDSFYENLSKRICELQFQNLKTLSSCTTVIDPKSLALPPFPKSPLASPLSPFAPETLLNGGGGCGTTAPVNNKASISRGSTPGESSLGEMISPAPPKTPSSPQPPINVGDKMAISLSRKTSKSSLSSLDIASVGSIEIPDICVQQDDSEIPNPIPPKGTNSGGNGRGRHRKSSTSSTFPGSVSPTELGLHFPGSPSPPVPAVIPPMDFPESASIAEGTLLLSPLLTAPSSPQKTSSNSADPLELLPLVSPKSPDFSNRKKLNRLIRSPSPSPNPASTPPGEEDNFLHESVNPDPNSCSTFLFSNHDNERDQDDGIEYSPAFPTALCPTQFSTGGADDDRENEDGESNESNGDIPSEEEIKINAVIRENIAILQRLKLKSAYLDEDDVDGDIDEDDSYEEIGEEFEDDECQSHSSGGGGRRSGSLGSDDRDSGVVPSSSKTSVATPKERLSSVSSNGSSRSRSGSVCRRRNSGNGGSGGGARRLHRGGSLASCSGSSIGLGKGAIGGCNGSAQINGGLAFNPFPTVRKARLRVTKYGLYN